MDPRIKLTEDRLTEEKHSHLCFGWYESSEENEDPDMAKSKCFYTRLTKESQLWKSDQDTQGG